MQDTGGRIQDSHCRWGSSIEELKQLVRCIDGSGPLSLERSVVGPERHAKLQGKGKVGGVFRMRSQAERFGEAAVIRQGREDADPAGELINQCLYLTRGEPSKPSSDFPSCQHAGQLSETVLRC